MVKDLTNLSLTQDQSRMKEGKKENYYPFSEKRFPLRLKYGNTWER
jgi:hypothetical protein